MATTRATVSFKVKEYESGQPWILIEWITGDDGSRAQPWGLICRKVRGLKKPRSLPSICVRSRIYRERSEARGRLGVTLPASRRSATNHPHPIAYRSGYRCAPHRNEGKDPSSSGSGGRARCQLGLRHQSQTVHRSSGNSRTTPCYSLASRCLIGWIDPSDGSRCQNPSAKAARLAAGVQGSGVGPDQPQRDTPILGLLGRE